VRSAPRRWKDNGSAEPTCGYHGVMSHRTELVILATLCVALFAGCLLVYTRHNSFPYYCHHDEQIKVEQLFTRDFNFNHPQLLLLSADLVRRARGQDDGYQRVTLSGRWVSAGFAAASVVLLALLGWRAFGLLGAWCVGLLVAVCPIVGLTAHFLKEDTALLLGLSAFLLALHLWLENPTSRRLIWLGLACGLAASAKYIGVLCLLAAILLVLTKANKAQGMSWRRQLALLLVPAALVFAVINWPLFSQLDPFTAGLDKGVNLVAHGRKPVGSPNFRAFERIISLSWPVLLMAAVGAACLMTVFRRRCIAGWILLGTLMLFAGILLLTPLGVPNRYILIPAVSLHALAGLAIVMLAELVAGHRETGIQIRARLAAAVAAGVLFWVAIPVYRSVAIDAFDQADARAELIAWVNSTLDEDAVLAASRKIRLPGVDGREPADPAMRLERDPITFENTIEINPDTLEGMRRNGITHVILREEEWSKFLAVAQPGVKPADSMLDSPISNPEIVWRNPERFRLKNRWLRGSLVVVQL
jgi:hypothetical protein